MCSRRSSCQSLSRQFLLLLSLVSEAVVNLLESHLGGRAMRVGYRWTRCWFAFPRDDRSFSCFEYFNGLIDLGPANGAVCESLGTLDAGDVVSAGEEDDVLIGVATNQAAVGDSCSLN